MSGAADEFREACTRRFAQGQHGMAGDDRELPRAEAGHLGYVPLELRKPEEVPVPLQDHVLVAIEREAVELLDRSAVTASQLEGQMRHAGEEAALLVAVLVLGVDVQLIDGAPAFSS